MPIVEIDGIGRVELSDDFTRLSPDQQNATIDEIVASVQPKGNISIRSNAKSAMDQVKDTALDVAKSAGTGLAKGAIGLAGLPEAASGWVDAGVGLAGRLAGYPSQPDPRAPSLLPSNEVIQKTVEGVTGEFYRPQTTAGKYAHTVGEFIPGALMGPGGVARNVATFGVAPGLASEAAGQVTEGTSLEPYARAGAALATGIGGAVLTAPGNAANTISRTSQGVTRQQFEAAEQLFQEAQAAGMPITRPEAIQYVTNGATNFGNLQRVVEGQGGMRDFYSQRAAQTDAAARQTFDAVAPVTNQPSTIGRAVGGAADDAVNDVRGGINTMSEPHYAAAANVRLSPQEMARVRAIPGYQEAVETVRNNPQLARYVQGLPEDSIGFLNEVKKQLDANATAARAPLTGNANHQVAAGWTQDAATARQIGIDASRRTPGNPYEQALHIQDTGRTQVLQPLLDGPLGKIANRDQNIKQAINVLFPTNPVPNSAQEIATAVAAVAARNPWAARQLVRAHLEMTFNEATQHLASGVNSYGGAKFAAVLRGNQQQAANLEAAIRALPNGDRIWDGVDRFLTVLETQGQRQAIGSQTAFSQEVLQDLRRGKLAAEAGDAILSGGIKAPATIKDRLERWRMGSGVDELARLFTDPQAGREFMRLAMVRGPVQVNGSIIRLVNMALVSSRQGTPKEAK